MNASSLAALPLLNAFSPDGSRLVSGMELGDALVWDIATAHEKLK